MEKIITLPNALTCLRIVMILPIIMLFQKEMHIAAVSCAIVAFLTDFFDGKIARKYDMCTTFGSILDPVADKLIVLFCMGYFAYRGMLAENYFYISATRDILQLMAIPVLIGWKKIAFKVKPKAIAKWATALKFIILTLLLASTCLDVHINFLLIPILILSGIIECYILFTYVPRFHKIYKGKHDTFE